MTLSVRRVFWLAGVVLLLLLGGCSEQDTRVFTALIALVLAALVVAAALVVVSTVVLVVAVWRTPRRWPVVVGFMHASACFGLLGYGYLDGNLAVDHLETFQLVGIGLLVVAGSSTLLSSTARLIRDASE